MPARGRTTRVMVKHVLGDIGADEEADPAEDDLAVWEGNKLRGVVLCRTGRTPEVLVFDEDDQGEGEAAG